MINLAVQYNNIGVDILCSSSDQTTSADVCEADTHSPASNECGIRDQLSGESCRKRRKSMTFAERQALEAIDEEARTEQQVDEALAHFQNALALILQNTERHYQMNGLNYYPNDEEGFFQYENDAAGKHLVSSINPCDTGITLKGEECCSNEYIYWKAMKIGKGEDGDDYSSRGNSNSTDYKSLTKSIYHSMICIYNIGMCYQYKGMIAKAKHMEVITKNQINPFAVGFDMSSNYYNFLNASVDHYTKAYDLMTRFRLEDSGQYTFLMAMMNNLASTYGSLGQTSKVDVCNRHLVRSMILVICSSERDGHLGQEVLSRTETKSVLRKEEDRTAFESFLSNVMHLMLGDGPNGDQRYSGNTVAAAA